MQAAFHLHLRGLPYLLFVSHLCQQRGGGAGLQRSLQIGLNTFQLADFFLPLGLPIGIQIGAPPAQEHVVLQLAAALEEAMPWGKRVPPLHVSSSRDTSTARADQGA